MIKRISLLALIIVLVFTILGCNPAQTVPAVDRLTVFSNSAQPEFPMKLNFKLEARSNVSIKDVRLSYKVEQVRFADVTSEAVLEFKPDTSVDILWTLDMLKVGGLPPGAVVQYWWSLEDEKGEKVKTIPNQVPFNDNRFSWKTLTEGKITLFWYEGDNSFAQSLITTATQGLARLATDTGASPDRQIKIYIYAGAKDLQGAMIFPQEWTGGVAYTEYSVIAIGITPSNIIWGQSAMTHELTHQVINQMVFNPYIELPTWLNEGLAMYNEGSLSPQFSTPLINAIINNKLITLRTLSSPFSAYTDISLLSYAQSYSVVEFLISQYGANKMNELLRIFKQGSEYDDAFKKVYGLDIEGLDEIWRKYVAAKVVPKR